MKPSRLPLILLVYLLIGILLISIFESTTYDFEYWFIIGVYFIFGLTYLFVIYREGLNVFHPVHLVTFLYFFIFIVTPLLMIISGSTDSHGTDVMDGCVVATFIFLLSYWAFLFGYLSINTNKSIHALEEGNNNNNNKELKLSYFFWVIGYMGSLIYLFFSGFSYSYILSFGMQGSLQEESFSSPLKFMINISYLMIIPLLYIIAYSKNKYLNIVLTFLTFSSYFIRGTRFIIIILVVSLIISFYRRRNKMPSASAIIIILLFSLITIGYLGYIRTSLRTGSSDNIENTNFGTENIVHSLETNFDIYKPFYGLVDKYPSEYSFTLGKSIFYDSLTMWIPRALWPSKPEPFDQTMPKALANSAGKSSLSDAYMSWVNIAEFYMEFGIIGCIVIMFVFGRFLKKSTDLLNSFKYEDVVKYAVLFPVVLQLVIRGYTPLNITLIVFLFIPWYVIEKFTKMKRIL